jgi:uncharacterized SAM-binding protein YcdF (DUF218 family)
MTYHRKLLMILTALIFACTITFFHFAGEGLIAHDVPHSADAIVVIGGDHKPERVRRAVELFEQGYAPLVIISAGTMVMESGQWMHEAHVMREQALRLGLPDAAMILETQSQTTIENAVYSKRLCEERHIDSILLVTSAYHSRRARMAFLDVMDGAINISIQPAIEEGFCTTCWWYQPDQRSVVLYEYKQLILHTLLQPLLHSVGKLTNNGKIARLEIVRVLL